MSDESTPCACEFYERAPLQHDMLLHIEERPGPYALVLICDLLAEEDMGVGNEDRLIEEPEDYGRFVAQHNWQDPVGMFHLGQAANWAAEQAWLSPRLMDLRALRRRFTEAGEARAEQVPA